MPDVENAFLQKMLDRLLAAVVTGPGMNCRPHHSRQRIDWISLAKFSDLSPDDALDQLLGGTRATKLTTRILPPRKPSVKNGSGERKLNGSAPQESDANSAANSARDPEKAAQQAWAEQNSLVNKLRVIADDARTYEQDTGVHVLQLGFPLLSIPPVGGDSGDGWGGSRRVLAPIALVPVSVSLKRGAVVSVEIACKGEGVDRVVPNTALMAWLEQKTGKAEAEMFADEEGADPWREIRELVRMTAEALEIPVPAEFAEPEPAADQGPPLAEARQGEVAAPVPPPLPKLKPAPRGDDESSSPTIIPAAVLGLFPVANQGLLRDMQAMAAGEALGGPVEAFVKASASLDAPLPPPPDPEIASQQTPPPMMRSFSDERLVAVADPCQARAVRLVRDCAGLVIHGPPGTGKSQTITNIVGDHLARGQRVLLVCDKRTALDVVENRLDHMGLGGLCAVVHDPQRDQRELYKSIREQLDVLAESKTNADAEFQLQKVDAELGKLHAELTRHRAALMNKPASGQPSFHELVGQWLATPAARATAAQQSSLAELTLAEFDEHRHDIHEILDRAASADFANNPWVSAAGVELEAFLARPMDSVRQAMISCDESAAAADATADPSIPPFIAEPDVSAQAKARIALADELERVNSTTDGGVRARWAAADASSLRAAPEKLSAAGPSIATFRSQALDPELAMTVQASPPAAAAIAEQLGALEAYLESSRKWYGFLSFGTKSRAAAVLRKYGLATTPDAAARLRAFLQGLRTRLVLIDLHHSVLTRTPPAGWLADEVLDKSLKDHAAVLELLSAMRERPELQGLAEPVAKALTDQAAAISLVEGLRKCPARAAAINTVAERLAASKLFSPGWINETLEALRKGDHISPAIHELRERVETLEAVLRTRRGLAMLPPKLREPVEPLAGTAAPEDGLASLCRGVLEAEIGRRLKADATLQSVDDRKVQHHFDRYRSLEIQKRTLVREAILHRWMAVQKERLLASTGSRLNHLGADLRRRLTIRGERAMRLRQVVASGRSIEGGDPLLDLRPIWMASPETVAQIFPRLPQFDVIVFDEASQCRLEEALPVLTRGNRVVIAGDPQQLPPTRFFESALAVSENDDDPETEQELFEAQQAEVEDLLGAALNLQIRQAYLDVHYRSRNADLIEFSNENFYGRRLQAIPGHPNNSTSFPPLTLYRVNGVYEKRANDPEAQQVCRIIHDLLKRADPPSIGVACFNLPQRDLILEKLDDLAAEDSDFARKLESARKRRGTSSFEGLFVKNLENVQGDERDHIIISTTYGPDAKGRFFRRFGPVGRAGGGRRLNVLVTRAREEVHLVTSIPREAYASLPPVPPGQTAGGAWLLFSYLAYAERVGGLYDAARHDLETAPKDRTPGVIIRPSRTPSTFAEALAKRLAQEHGVASDVYFGNDGFLIDAALRHPDRREAVTIGLLCDSTRFGGAEDPVEWDLFRTAIHESQGWRLHRVWTPHFYRDPTGSVRTILKEAQEESLSGDAKDALRTTPATEDSAG